MMMMIYLFITVIFVVCFAVLHLLRKRNASSTPTNTNPNFATFQKVYFIAYLTALFADWLQSPYQYKLYSHYGFEEAQIAVLYVCGFASTVVLGSWAPVVADRFGRKKLCIVFTLIYSVASLVKLSSNYFVLIVGRVLGGVATSLLFSAFESWYLHEHVETHDFPKEWIQETFEKADFWNGILAIFAGIVANVSAEWLNLGPVSPYVMAVPVLLVVGVLISTQWTENRSAVHVRVKKSCMDGLRDIGRDPKIFLAGIVQSLFESTMYIFVFIWTPVLDKSHAPLGFVFASFMASTVTGAATFDLLRRRGVSAPTLLTLSVVLAGLGNVLAAVAARPDDTRHTLAFAAFIIIEFSVGVYFRAMTIVRTRVVPQETRSAINSWFRVPLNLIACIILMCLHDDAFRHGNRLIFISCAALLVLASIGVTCLTSLIQRDDDFGDVVTVNGAKGNGANSNLYDNNNLLLNT